jgi:hypothetical protein
MSYFSRHLVYGPPEPKYKIIVSREVKNEKTGTIRLMPCITFFDELDPDQIIEQAQKYLSEKYGQDWDQKYKYHLDIIPPEEE